MFGISWAEFLVVLLVAMLVIPADNWGDVARFIARIVKFIRDLIWKISDAGEQIKEHIDLEKPIDDLIKTTTDDVLGTISTALPKKRNNAKKTK
jgi:Sec-independent protein translocase protein TatA